LGDVYSWPERGRLYSGVVYVWVLRAGFALFCPLAFWLLRDGEVYWYLRCGCALPVTARWLLAAGVLYRVSLLPLVLCPLTP